MQCKIAESKSLKRHANQSLYKRQFARCSHPQDLAIFEPSQNVIIGRKGDTLVLRAAERKRLEHVTATFACFSPGFMVGGRGEPDWLEAPERDWRGDSAPRVQQERAA